MMHRVIRKNAANFVSQGTQLPRGVDAKLATHLFDLMEKEHRDRIRDRNDFIGSADE